MLQNLWEIIKEKQSFMEIVKIILIRAETKSKTLHIFPFAIKQS